MLQHAYHNLMEPYGLIDAFLAEPPRGFVADSIATPGGGWPCFLTELDLLTTVDPSLRTRLAFLAPLLPRPQTLFVGTTLSEYTLVPKEVTPDALIGALMDKIADHGVGLAVIKGLPQGSPLVTASENAASSALLAAAAKAGFVVFCGEALAYVPIRFNSLDEFMSRFSHGHRKDLRRKWRSRAELEVDEIPTGAHPFLTLDNLKILYDLYLNVYDASAVHFDCHTFAFFRRVLTDARSHGVIFVYRRDGVIIGFNLCFVHNGNLIDKYIGLRYPEARQCNLYFVSWLYNIEYCLRHKLQNFLGGCYALDVKSRLGAEFTYNYHAAYLRNPVLRALGRTFKSVFEGDMKIVKGLAKS